jgi:hypothetical protein
MNKRIRAKRAKAVGRHFADSFTLYTILSRARPSLLTLSHRRRCAAIRDCAREKWGLGMKDRAAKRIQRLALSELPITTIKRSGLSV